MPIDANPRRRQLITSALGLFGAAAVTAAGGRLSGGAPRLDASGNPVISGVAQVSQRAERLGIDVPDPPSPGKLLFPVDPSARSFVLDNFGDCRSGGSRRHQGVDIMSERGAPVYAVAAGRLHGQFTNSGTAGFGWTLRTDDATSYRYFHLDSFAPGLRLADTVSVGQVIGYVGSSGNFITVDDQRVEDRNNIHLHFEVLRDHAGAVDPLPLIEVPGTVKVGAPLKSCLHVG